MDSNILIVDDEKEIADLVELYLINEGFVVHKFYRGKEALDCIYRVKLDLAILDVMLPDMDGFSICRRIRENHNFPVIMLTAKEEEIDKITGLTLGAECSIGLASQISTSEQNFVKLMNLKAGELGMKDTHFTNATGLHNKNHYTTVKDMALLLNYSLRNDEFREIFTSSRHTTKPTNKHPSGITFYSTMFEKLKDPDITGGEVLGGKTGYTDEAGLCLASLAKKGGKEYILVTAGAKGNHNSEQYNITDALAVYNSLEGE